MKGLLVVVWLMLVPETWAITTLRWDISNETAHVAIYSTFLESLRNEVKDSEITYFEIPVIMGRPTIPPTINFTLVEIQASEGKSITLSLNKENLYVLGYSDIVIENNVRKCRYHVFADQVAKCTDHPHNRCGLCPEVTDAKLLVNKPINYKSRYEEIEKNARVGSRSEMGLGFSKLNGLVKEVVYGSIDKGTTIKNEAKCLLVAIQMISEATRFKFLQNRIPSGYYEEFYPGEKVLCLELKWAKASRKIKSYTPTPVTDEEKARMVIDVDCWSLIGLERIKNDIALLCNKCDDPEETTITTTVEVNEAIDNTRHQVVGKVSSLISSEFHASHHHMPYVW